jgi:hypothetical protein
MSTDCRCDETRVQVLKEPGRDPTRGATASAQIYSLVETAKANGQEPYTWLRHVLERLPQASLVKDFQALLPWNCSPEMPR